MNYKNVAKKKKKNTAIIVVASILALVLAGGAIAGLGFHFDWWGAEEAPQKKEVPTSTYNLEIASLDDLIGVEFTPEDFSGYLSTYNKTKQELEQMGAIDSVDDELEENIEMMHSILNVTGSDLMSYGVDFKLPEDGQYEFVWKINGVDYSTKYAGFEKQDDIVQGCCYVFYDKDLNSVDVEFGTEPEIENGGYISIMLLKGVMINIDDRVDNLDGYTLMIENFSTGCDGLPIETLELVSYKRIGDVPVEESGSNN